MGRKVGVLVSDGSDAALLDSLRSAVKAEGAMLEVIAPIVGGVTAGDGSKIAANYNLDGGPSVLFDAVVVLTSQEGAQQLSRNPVALDFVTDAHAHCKFIGYVEGAMPLLDKANVAEMMDDGFVDLESGDMDSFIQSCRKLRLWERENIFAN